jgi:hypothetical protein
VNRRVITAILAAIAATILLTASSCEPAGSDQRDSDQAASAKTYQQQTKAQPYPAQQLRDSLERANLRERLLRENVSSQVRYIYLLGDTGTYIGYYAIKGKVSSNQSQMQPQDDVYRPCTSCDRVVVDGPGDDGSYGEDARGQFFFTTEGVMVSTDMRYIVSDAPLAVDAPRLNVPKK